MKQPKINHTDKKYAHGFMTDRDINLYQDHLDGMKNKDIAVKYNITPSYTSQCILRIKTNIKYGFYTHIDTSGENQAKQQMIELFNNYME